MGLFRRLRVQALPDVATAMTACTIAIEWDNLQRSELGRARRMACVLREEMAACEARGGPVQLLVLYDPGQVARSQPDGVLADAGFGPSQREAALVEAPGLRYYDLKNHAATLAVHGVLVFVDCDVVPERGWLTALLAPLADPNVAAVAGNSYIQPTGWYRRSVAAFWFFPPRSAPEEAASDTNRFFANNVAFRTEVFRAHGFPRQARFRGQCAALGDALESAGLRIRTQPHSRVEHPPPNGVGHFLARAIAAGSDSLGTRRAWRRLRKRIRQRRHALQMTPAQVFVAYAVAGVYALGMHVGKRVDRGVVERWFPI